MQGNWEYIAVSKEGRVKHWAFHPQGNTCMWLDVDAEPDNAGNLQVLSVGINVKGQRAGFTSLEEHYRKEGRLDVASPAGRENPRKTWLAFIGFHKLLRAGRVPRVRDSSGNLVTRGFDDAWLPESVIEIQRMQGAVTEKGFDDFVKDLGRGEVARPPRDRGSEELAAIEEAILNPQPLVDVTEPETLVEEAKQR